MNFKTFAAPVLSASLLFSPLLELPSNAASQGNVDNWEYITDAADGTLYFGANQVNVGKTTVIEIKAVNDPEEPNLPEYTFREAFNCETRQVKGEKGWEKVDTETVADDIFAHACGV